MNSRSRQVSFGASQELYDAIEIMAYTNSETIAATIRRIVAKELVSSVLLDPRAPVTEQTAASNGLYVTKKVRNAREAAEARQ